MTMLTGLFKRADFFLTIHTYKTVFQTSLNYTDNKLILQKDIELEFILTTEAKSTHQTLV